MRPMKHPHRWSTAIISSVFTFSFSFSFLVHSEGHKGWFLLATLMSGGIMVTVIALLFDIGGDRVRGKWDILLSVLLLYTLYNNFPMLFNSKEKQPKERRNG